VTAAESYAAAGIEILERDGDTVYAAIQTPTGIGFVMADLFRVERCLTLDRVHMDG
jgi:hypothetical protein